MARSYGRSPGLLLAGLALLLVAGCTEDGQSPGPGDTVPPCRTEDLAATCQAQAIIALTWTAPGDDGTTGVASQYDVRYSTSLINSRTGAASWDSATQIVDELPPKAAGEPETLVVTALQPATVYYFALKAGDEIPNWSELSNVANDTTQSAADTTAPAAATDLYAGSPTTSSIILIWTAPGDDSTTGSATEYDIRFSGLMITEESWDSASQVDSEPVPRTAGEAETLVVTDLDAGTAYFFAMKAADEVPNWSELSNVTSGTTSAAPDTIAPAAVEDLVAEPQAASSVLLTWTAPGDDGEAGVASRYDIRYATSTITYESWDSATQVEGELPPKTAGEPESLDVEGLAAGTLYFFALRAVDESENWSGLSNVASCRHTLTYLVKWDGTGDFPTIQEAVYAASDGDTVLLADGGFTGNGNRDVDYLGKAITVRSESGDPERCVIDCQGSEWEPHRGFVFQRDEGPESVLERVTIANGYGWGGGGIFCFGSSPVIRGCIISWNDGASYGGGIYCRQSSLTVSECTITQNVSTTDGGGIYSRKSAITISGCNISGNSAARGGGVYCEGTIASITGCTISENEAASYGAGILCVSAGNGGTSDRGGSEESFATISACTLSGNNAKEYGGGIFCWGGDHWINTCTVSENHSDGAAGIGCLECSAEISECTVSSNNSDCDGGGILWFESDGSIHGCTISGNTAVESGGGIKCTGFTLEVAECDILDNSAYSGGGLECEDTTILRSTISGNTAISCGGGIKCIGSAVEIADCEILDNSAHSGGGLECAGIRTILRCTFSGNSGDLGGGIRCTGGNASFRECTISGNSATEDGGGIYFTNASPSITFSTISMNSASHSGGGIYCNESSPIVSFCTLSGNNTDESGGGIYCYSSSPTIASCTIYGSSCTTHGAGVRCEYDSHPTMERTILAFCPSGEAVSCQRVSTATLTCCCIYGNEGGDWVGCIQYQLGMNGNICEDPCFWDPLRGDFSLEQGSPCAPFSPPNEECDLIGAWP